MNVSLELPDDLGHQARRRAVSVSKSLSAWITDLVVREVSPGVEPVPDTLLEALGDDSTADRDLPLPERGPGRNMPLEFP